MRQGLGRGRPIVAVGGVLALLGSFLPWVSAGELTGQVVTGNGLSGTGILVFVSAVGLLMIILFPYASASGRSSLDQPPAYAILCGISILGMLLTLAQLWTADALRLWPPDRAPGLVLAVAGVVISAIGVAEVIGERDGEPPLRPRR